MTTFAIEKSSLSWFDLPANLSWIEFTLDELEQLKHSEPKVDYIIFSNNQQLCLQAFDPVSQKYLSHHIDVDGFIKQLGKSFPASKKNLFGQAIGRKTQSVIDATGGWMGDSMLMCSQNYQLYILERYWLLQGFIEQACQRWQQHDWVVTNQVPVPKPVKGDAIQLLEQNELVADCIYIDPMFPPKIKKSAEVRKSMRVLHDLIGQDTDAKVLFNAAYATNVKRIVVKRPDYADNLSETIKPSEVLSGKLVRYDVYLR